MTFMDVCDNCFWLLNHNNIFKCKLVVWHNWLIDWWLIYRIKIGQIGHKLGQNLNGKKLFENSKKIAS